MVIRDMRYMWSEIDSGLGTSERHQPSRGVVLRRERRWRNGRGVVGAGDDCCSEDVDGTFLGADEEADGSCDGGGGGGGEKVTGRGGSRAEMVWESSQGLTPGTFRGASVEDGGFEVDSGGGAFGSDMLAALSS